VATTRLSVAWVHARAIALALLAAAPLPTPTLAQAISDLTGLTGLLQPGSRPALALGGDPFCSPVDDQDGWWQRPGLSRGQEVIVEGTWSEPLRTDVANLQRTIAGRWAVDPSVARGRVRLGGEIIAPDWGIRWASGDGGMRLEGSGVGGTLGMRVRELVPGFTVQAVSPTIGDRMGVRSTPAGVGARYCFRTLAVVQAAWETSREPEVLRSDLYGEPIEASLNLRTERTRVDASIRLPGRLRVEGSAGWGDFQDLEARQAAPVYHLAPLGRSTLAQASVAWQSPIGWRVLGRYTHRELEIQGTASWGGQRFAEISPGRAGQESYLLGAEYVSPGGSRWLIDAETVRAEARARLELETWPFTSATVDLLGLRRIYRAQGEARWHRAHVGFVRPVRRTALISAGLAGYDIAPAGTLESWRPVFLVFGSADREFDRLDTRRLQLVALSFGFGLAFGNTRFDLAAQQFVFAKSFQSAAHATGGGTVPEPTGAVTPTDNQGRGWSGNEIRISVSRSFAGTTPR
jgi:hypothetical protein